MRLLDGSGKRYDEAVNKSRYLLVAWHCSTHLSLSQRNSEDGVRVTLYHGQARHIYPDSRIRIVTEYLDIHGKSLRKATSPATEARIRVAVDHCNFDQLLTRALSLEASR